jgi:hypothetical protein
MIWKLLLTLVLILTGWFYLRHQWRHRGPPAEGVTPRLPLTVTDTMRTIAYGIITVMLVGSGWSLYRGWESGHEVLRVQVVNANTGVITPYEARRRDIDGRVFRTLDGREIRLADVERMILLKEGQGL